MIIDWYTRRIIKAKQYLFYNKIETCVRKECTIKLLSYLLIGSIKYYNFHHAFKPILLVHMSFLSYKYAYHIMVFLT